MSIFTLELLQAVNDWQRGGDHDQKVRRGNALKQAVASLPEKFRTCDVMCYRQEAHEEDRIFQLLADERLPETIAGWTTEIDVARSIKGGVPPPHLRGVIFCIRPPAGSVVANLAALYADPDFQAATEELRPRIVSYGAGIGEYGDRQKEAVLELDHLSPDTIFRYGGHASISLREGFIAAHGRDPTDQELAFVEAAMPRDGADPGAWWLSEDGTRNVMTRMRPKIDALKARHAGTP